MKGIGVMVKIHKLLPKSIKRQIYWTVSMPVKKYEEKNAIELEAMLPKISLEEKHMRNLKVLTDKATFLNVLPKGAIGAEIGVAQGNYTEKILSVTQPQKLHLIDAWTQKQYAGLRESVENRFNSEIKDGQVFLHQGFSINELEKFDDRYFDWVYIDTDHSYNTTTKELDLCRRKVKVGGIIAGHDYTVGAWIPKVRYGVIEAVNEFCHKYNWEMIFLTNEYHRNLSFALKEIV